jgi:aminoglycoside 3-N-acetyltransferase
MEKSKSAVGYLSEYFRTQVSGVKRSRHATHSCCAWGKYRDFLLENHEKDTYAVGKNSPIYKMQAINGKILFLGCSTDRNTAMHGVERLYGEVPFSMPFEGVYTIETETGEKISQTLSRGAFVVNGVEYAQKYSRMENLLNKSEMQKGKLLQADCVVMSSKAVWEKGLQKMQEDVFYFVEAIQ